MVLILCSPMSCTTFSLRLLSGHTVSGICSAIELKIFQENFNNENFENKAQLWGWIDKDKGNRGERFKLTGCHNLVSKKANPYIIAKFILNTFINRHRIKSHRTY